MKGGLSFLLAAVLVTPVFAQSPAFESCGHGCARFNPPRLIQPVTDMPYSTDRVTEHIQILADGTRFSNVGPKTRVYRDSPGRTRTEQVLQGRYGSTQIVEIADPVAGYRLVLDTTNRVAHRSALPAPPPTPPRRTVPANSLVAPAAIGPHDEDLGNQEIQGVTAHGLRHRSIFDTGTAGNDRPFVVTFDSWKSDELQLVLVSKFNDPRHGEFTTKLENLTLSKPDPALFQVPADYHVVDETGPFTIQIDR